ncbi:glycosyltransferase [Deinococcus sp. LM3]|uniref:glycosyltransferase n=1 Tax=Deinococcus sp. LM3 TaxID=1938608 RepID=UPI000992289E|nr:glycosyltransferase [Deinococcus sp. LM3]OOV14673.1 hypothetical protein BXU09_08380 [Deinococcus sp. LM3]
MISVCMATYNGFEYIPAQINSILGQIDSGDEILIQDDCSSDETIEYLKSLKDDRIIIEINKSNLGVIPTFERCLKRARGDIIFLSDQDDVWIDGKVSNVMSEFCNPRTMAVVTNAEIIDNSGAVIHSSYFALNNSGAGVLKNFHKNSYLGCCLAFRRDVLEFALKIPVGVRTHDGWIGIVANMMGDVVFLDKILLKYRRHDKNVSQMHRFGILDIVKRRALLASHMLRVMVALKLKMQDRRQVGGKI